MPTQLVRLLTIKCKKLSKAKQDAKSQALHNSVATEAEETGRISSKIPFQEEGNVGKMNLKKKA